MSDVLGKTFHKIIEFSIMFVIDRGTLNLKRFYIRYLQTITMNYAKMEGVGIILLLN